MFLRKFLCRTAVGSLLLLSACAEKNLSERSVTEFVDAADKAFLRGDAIAICAARAPTFEMRATEFKLSGNQVVADFAEAQSITAKRQAAGELLSGESVTMQRREYCAMAADARDFYKRASMERGPLTVKISADGKQAVVTAHYTVREPMYEYGDSPHGSDNRVERQVATRQSESDDESVIVLDDGELKFIATKSVTKSFVVASERDRNL
jgi:hypothetical protein